MCSVGKLSLLADMPKEAKSPSLGLKLQCVVKLQWDFAGGVGPTVRIGHRTREIIAAEQYVTYPETARELPCKRLLQRTSHDSAHWSL